MPEYQYKCSAGHLKSWVLDQEDRDHYIGQPCLATVLLPGDAMFCSEPLKRVFSFSAPPMMHEHYNPTVGKTISSMHQFKSELTRASDTATARTGIPCSYEPVSLQEMKPPQEVE